MLEADLADGTLHPNATKRRLARLIVSLYNGEQASVSAEDSFNRVFKDHLAPEDVATVRVVLDDEVYLPGLLHEVGLVGSASEGRRMIDQGAVRLNGKPLVTGVYMYARTLVLDQLLQVGKRRFARPIQGD